MRVWNALYVLSIFWCVVEVVLVVAADVLSRWQAAFGWVAAGLFALTAMSWHRLARRPWRIRVEVDLSNTPAGLDEREIANAIVDALQASGRIG